MLAALVALVLLTYDSYGVSNDEPVQQRYGELIIAYYTSGFADRSLFALDNLYLYGGLFDVAATLIARALAADVYSVRHLLCAMVGIGGIAAAWATARLVAGPRAGLIAVALLAVTGAWYGAMFNHTKDIPFAAAMMGATYWLMRAARDLPRPRWRDVLGFGLMLGAALGVRAMGLILGIYLVVAIMLSLVLAKLAGARARLAFAGRSFAIFVPALVLAHLIMLAFWPWAALDPFNPVRANLEFAQFHYDIRDLFAGAVYRMDAMPRAYLPVYLGIRLPLVMLAGAAIALAPIAVPRLLHVQMAHRTRLELVLLAFVAMFPVAVQVALRSPIFSGMRHFTFVVPPIAVIAACGLAFVTSALARWQRAAATAAGFAIAAMIVVDAISLVRLHPHQYLAYNVLTGGLRGAAGRFATDYWVNTMPEAVRSLEDYLRRQGYQAERPSGRYNVSVCAQRLQFERVAGDRLRWTDTWEDADFYISPTHMDCDAMLDGNVIAIVERTGVILAVVKDRRAIIGRDAR